MKNCFVERSSYWKFAASLLVLSIVSAAIFPVASASAAEKFDWVKFYFDGKPNTPYQIAPNLYFGAEVELDTEGEFNLNLDRGDNEDEVLFKPELQLNVLYDNDSWLRAYLEFQLSRDFVVRSPDDDPQQTALEIKEAYVTLFGADRNTGLTIGRWNVSDEREWLFDDDLDGVQFAWRNEKTAFELMYARKQLLQKDLLGTHETGNPDNFYGRFYAEPFKDALASVYGLYQHGRMPGAANLLWIGGSLSGEADKDIDYWLEAATVTGTEGGRDVFGFGFDAGLTKTFKDMSLRPRLTAAVAFGSGDDGNGSDSAFRQTGLQGNGDRFGGRKSFKYYGEVFDPELSNLGILTLGAGVNVSEKTTVDVVYHRYYQHRAANNIRDSALDEDSSGNNRHLGDEIDIIVGFRELEKIDIDLIAGVFLPGTAFEGDNDPAYFAGLEFKIKF